MSSPANAPAPAPPPGSRLAQLRAAPRTPGEASFFYWDANFGRDAVRVLPGEFFVSQHDMLIVTTLGSCIAACLWDRERRIGGMNHFMLPDGDGGRYGSYAMEMLINSLLKRGATRATLEAKVFGGGAVIAEMASLNVGERNTRFVFDYLSAERIPLVSKDVLDRCVRKVCLLAASGKALVKRLTPANPAALAAQEREAAERAAPHARRGGTVDLF
ncbi:MAG: chemoreceptor glutamine deamidase CheD [Burkholderiaceae bacterium]|uniref:chemoreceptor glutamine deamidase CheD n=1 Tax=Geobacter sp. TaxID=46610 RepID=UPI00142917F4|nr:chemoreceptor glutamine deamidase CheD [Geobacter sp.]KAB2875506.1 MAG: chemoreceptor glutamine deamidase CheD [Burkholderiaceae bacterium]MBE7426955.1 chemoreceptor glutamine deamidase CheD [Ideonella sp.]MCC7286314.1 chemoreceptor glutamine deamidase CheD [Burkholderiaceae bacterium]